uniref:Uncharacterized protein n=1 Tax=Utricularia reniformis TaxID=192314 RepID=A0A1Y0B2H8_9LAMI|nr:hypothetical protein AEK19_MT1455 [Utricularia reniformis]ART31646.1 hypothetical protein AEK19_MT1455 [Utricularia reniformis]
MLDSFLFQADICPKLIEVLIPDMPLALAVDYLASKPKPIESCLPI